MMHIVTKLCMHSLKGVASTKSYDRVLRRLGKIVNKYVFVFTSQNPSSDFK